MVEVSKLVERIAEHEGFRSEPYRDTRGRWTIGHGITWVTKEESLRLVENRVDDLFTQCRTAWDWFDSLSDTRQEILVEMAYNLGFQGLCKFERMLSAMASGRWPDAAAEMLSSLWARQVGKRAKELAGLMILPGDGI